jgi:hypothetical protein
MCGAAYGTGTFDGSQCADGTTPDGSAPNVVGPFICTHSSHTRVRHHLNAYNLHCKGCKGLLQLSLQGFAKGFGKLQCNALQRGFATFMARF